MAEPAVVQRLREFKDGVLAQEASQMRLMARRWLAVEEALDAQIVALAEQTARMPKEAVTIGRLYRLERYRKLLAQAQREFEKYAAWAEGVVVGGQTQMAMLGLEHATEILGMAAVGYGWDRLNADAVANMIGMTGDGTPLGDLLKLRMVRDSTGLPLPGVAERLAQSLVNATAQGWNPRRTARKLKDDLTGGLDKALQITRTEQIRAYRQASLRQYQASGVVTGVARLCAHNDRTCVACLADEGHVYPVDEGIPDHVQGRCSGVPQIAGVENLRFETGEQWMRSQSATTQEEMLGPKRYALWKEGKVKFSEFATHTSDPTWGGSVKVTPIKILAA